mgnify:CR=1 FL=1
MLMGGVAGGVFQGICCDPHTEAHCSKSQHCQQGTQGTNRTYQEPNSTASVSDATHMVVARCTWRSSAPKPATKAGLPTVFRPGSFFVWLRYTATANVFLRYLQTVRPRFTQPYHDAHKSLSALALRLSTPSNQEVGFGRTLRAR